MGLGDYLAWGLANAPTWRKHRTLKGVEGERERKKEYQRKRRAKQASEAPAPEAPPVVEPPPKRSWRDRYSPEALERERVRKMMDGRFRRERAAADPELRLKLAAARKPVDRAYGLRKRAKLRAEREKLALDKAKAAE